MILVAVGVVIIRAAPDPAKDAGAATVLDREVEAQADQLRSDEPRDNPKLRFTGFRRIGTVEALATDGKALLVADFEAPTGMHELTFEIWESSEVASLRFREYMVDARGPAFLDAPTGSWARFCRDSSDIGVECYGRVENAVIRGLVQSEESGDVDVEKVEAGLLVNIGVKHWMGTFGTTDDTS